MKIITARWWASDIYREAKDVITPEQIREFRELRGLSLRDVAKFCDVSPQLIGQVETNVKPLTPYNYEQIISGINKASAAKQSNNS